MSLPRVISETLGGSPLSVAAQRAELSPWYVPRPTGAAGWRVYLRQLVREPANKTWLRELAPAFDARGKAAEQLRRVFEGNGAVISTGQQAALFGGPLYTLTKAVSVLAFADVLERGTSIPIAPVFWAATDDADFEEAASAHVAVIGEIRTFRLQNPEQAGVAMNDVPMPGVEPLIERLADACGSVIEPSVLDDVRDCYTSRATLGAAYVRQLRRLLEPLGIAVIDASHPALRIAAAPVLRRALERAVAVEQALRQRSDAIRAAGYAPQVDHLPALSLVFSATPGEPKTRIPVADALSMAGRAPETLGPNVLLRPIVERFIMPSAAYVAGPGETAYFAQVSAVAEALDLPTPLPIPRWSATIIEPRVERVLTRLGISREELRDRHALETKLARQALPSTISQTLQRLRHQIGADVAALEVIDRDKLIPPASLQGLRRSLLHRVERTERRYVAAVKRRETELMRDIGTAAAALYPGGERQERVLNFVPFIARYGKSLIDQMTVEAERHAMFALGTAAPDLTVPVAERV
ncbi:MAG TPA: bacillithiol biosynthesis cysteine-adding enzyme BshC [Gemmatimonadaceae bacterium]|nr:bacillithiol biosynthesis cysteine-adding enzyme BshC [Gemmatimonadaceae bacterium]